MMKKYCLVFWCLILVFNAALNAQTGVNDACDGMYNYKVRKQYKRFSKKSLYLTMRDGTQLAADVYLPKGLGKGAKVPTILYQTRYYRSVQLRGLLLGKIVRIIPSTPNFELKEFIHNGYALVCVDVRGTGASQGCRTLSLPDTNEIKDGAEIADWIIKQVWSDGQIGATGISYIGIAAEYMMMNKHRALKAVAPLFTPFDLYDDVGMPGGIYASKFINGWNDVCRNLDVGKLPENRNGVMAKLLVSGVGKAHPSKGRMLRKQAFDDHCYNYYQTDDGALLEYMDDDFSKNGVFPRSVFKSPHLSLKEINESNLPIFSYTGWWDLGFTKGGIRQYLNFTNPNNKLTIGPWGHGGVKNISHFSGGKSQYNHVAAVMSFFDYHLKGIKTGIEKEPTVKYYTIGQERWKTAPTWPPPNTRNVSLFLGVNNQLSSAVNTGNLATLLRPDTTFGSGSFSRWSLILSQQGDTSKDWTYWSNKLLSYTGNTLQEDQEITGHPILKVSMKSNKPDGAIFAYLLDIDSTGKAFYVSEGHLRLVHRKVQSEPTNYKDAVPHHTFFRSDASPMPIGVVQEVVFDLFPISYEFKKGHKIKLCFATDDKDYFKQTTEAGTEYEIMSDSELVLPLMPK